MQNAKLKMQKAVFLEVQIKSNLTESGSLCLVLLEN